MLSAVNPPSQALNLEEVSETSQNTLLYLPHKTKVGEANNHSKWRCLKTEHLVKINIAAQCHSALSSIHPDNAMFNGKNRS